MKTIHDLPQPKGKLVLGNLAEFKDNNKHRVIQRWSDTCGPIFKIRLANQHFIVSTDPDFNGQVLKNRPDGFSRFNKINEIFQELGIKGVFNAEGSDWKRHRKVSAEALNAKKISAYYPHIQQTTENLIQLIESKKQPVDFLELCMRYTIDITTRIAFGHELNTLQDGENSFQRHLEKVFPAINKRITAPFPSWRYIKSKSDKELENSLKEVQNVIHEFIENAQQQLKANDNQASNFLEVLLQESASENFTTEEVFGNIFTMLLAGEDTTANSIAWATYFLCEHPEWIVALRNEANEVYQANKVLPHFELIQQLPIAKAIAEEAIRLKPTTPQLFMQANEDVTINDVAIKKDQVVMLQNMHAQLSENYFLDAADFQPERWLKAACPYHAKHHPEVVRAFGAGPRFCPGMYLAMNEMVVCLSALAKNFDLRLDNGNKQVDEHFAFTMHPTNLSIQFQSLVN